MNEDEWQQWARQHEHDDEQQRQASRVNGCLAIGCLTIIVLWVVLIIRLLT